MSASPTTENSRAPRAGRALAAIAAITTVLAISLLRAGPPAPRSADAPPELFSAERALEVLARILGDQLPHPTGSAENDAVRARLITELEAVGLEAQVQSTLVCTPWATCAELHNVVARIDGSDPGPGLLLLSHYDSQAHAPGAADDGSGVAVWIETARALRGVKPKRTLIFLFSDGEETGLAGAFAFARQHPWQADVGAVVNFEARGSRGPSLMFQTGANSGAWVDRWGDVCPRPRGSSLFASIYERMPNDTDFTVWKDLGFPGLNFAFTGEVSHYHTALDDLAHLSLGTVQHHGDCALALARSVAVDGLAGAAPSETSGERVYFDVFGFGLASWSAGLAPGLLVAAVALLTIAIRRSGVGLASIVPALGWWLLCVATPLLAAALFVWLLRAATGSSAPWTASPAVALTAVVCLGLATLFAVATTASSRLGPTRFAIANALWLSLFGTASTFLLVGASYLFVLPVLCIAAALLIENEEPGFATLSAASVTAIVHVPTALLTVDALGLGVAPVVVFPLALGIISFVPVLATQPLAARVSARLLGAVALAASLIIIVSPAYSPDHPAGLNLLFVQEDTAEPRWIVSGDAFAASPDLLATADFQTLETLTALERTLSRGRASLRATSSIHRTPAPTIEWLGDQTDRHLRFRATSLRGATTVGITTPGNIDLKRIRLNGIDVVPIRKDRMKRAGGLWMARWVTAAPNGVEFELEFESPPEWIEVYDLSNTLPHHDEARRLRAARGSSALPVHGGDSWVVSKQLVLPRAGRSKS